MDLPNLPFWGWIIVVFFSLLTLVLPFVMMVRLPYIKRIRMRAAARSKETLAFFWVLAYLTYLILIWLILWGYGAFDMF